MISEREFSNHYGSFWRATLPNLESVTRSLNLNTITEWDEIHSFNDPNRRDVIAETAFTLASIKFSSPDQMAALVSEAENIAISNLRRLTRSTNNSGIPQLNENEIAEVNDAASRILQLAQLVSRQQNDVRFRPRFFGHGFLHECEGDLAAKDDIYEFKYVSRNFRSADFKQALTYAALHWFKTQKSYKNICLINPFRGITIAVPVTELVSASGGGSFQDFCRSLSHFVSSGDISR